MVAGDAAGQVAPADGGRGQLDLAERVQGGAHHRVAGDGQAAEHGQAHEQVDVDQAVHRGVDVVQAHGQDEGTAPDRNGYGPVVPVARIGVDREGLTGEVSG